MTRSASRRRAPHPLHAPVRAARVAVLTAASVAIAAMAHVAAGGAPPEAGPLLVAAAVFALVGVIATGRRCGRVLFAGILLTEQFVAHVLFAASMAPGRPTGDGCVVAPSHHAMALACAVTPAPAQPDSAGWPMLALHLLAVLATAWLLARGEAWLWRSAGRIVRAALTRPSRRRARPLGLVLAVSRVTVGRAGRAPAAPRGPPAWPLPA